MREFMRQDCFWSAMNFFSDEPDNRFFDSDHTQTILRTDYDKVREGEKQFGDILLLLGPANKALHMCVYVADDVVFTKNGANTIQPWVLMKMSEMLGTYEPERPFEVIVYRRKTGPPVTSPDPDPAFETVRT